MKRITLVSTLTALTLPLFAQTVQAPQFINPWPGTTFAVTNMSDNGKWLITETAGTTDGSISPAGGTLISVDDSSVRYTLSHTSGLAGVGDVTDDGSIVVGECQNRPAYWSLATKSWTTLPLPTGYTTGRLSAVTPDGHYAVGYVNNGDLWVFDPVCYDLTTNTVVELPNLPTLDMQNTKPTQHDLVGISPDGRYILGNLSQSYLMPTQLCSYVYDRETATYDFIGFDESTDGKSAWSAQYSGLTFISSPRMSPNGEWVTGFAYIYSTSRGSEYYAAFRYDVKNKSFEVYDGEYDSDMAGFSVLNDGTVLGGTPPENPYSTAMVRSGNYFYSFDQIFSQVYGITDFEATTGYSVTGKPVCVSADGLTIALLPSTDETYIVKLSTPIAESAQNIDLLGDYTINPEAGSKFSQMKSLTINFGRPVSLVGNAQRITISDGASSSAKALKASVEASTVTISFQTLNLNPGSTYTVTIPAGIFALAGDTNIKNREIKFDYVGRAEGPVKPVSAYPADGNAFSRFDMSSNPLIITFDSDITALGPTGQFYRIDEDGEELLCNLSIATGGNQLLVYPSTGQYLYKDVKYRVVIPAGTVGDLSGNGANEEITYTYTGTYEREIVTGEKYLFQGDGTLTTDWMFYDGDQNTPAEIPAGWDFTSEYPWYAVRESSSSDDWAMVSHSMYDPAGKSDDWASTTQIYIPDESCVLTFDSQSYLKSKKDYLKVYILATDDIFSYLTSTVVARFRANGDLVYNELQDPGEDQEQLSGDWRHNVISLEKYAGKYIYIAFVNENEDQSAIFIDNITVLHDVKYAVSFETPARVINKTSTTIKGSIGITSEVETYNTVGLTLKDGEGNTIDTINETGLSLKNGDIFTFSFSKDLPLTAGKENKYSVDIKLNDEESSVSSSVKNLTFEPTQRIVLEEYTGQNCPNCPRGIVGIDYLHTLFGSKFIPVALHCYSGDELGAGVTAYNNFLGLNAAPSGIINRNEVSEPMEQVDGAWRFSGNPDQLSWLDWAQIEFDKQVDAQIDITSSTYDVNTRKFTVSCEVKSAIDLEQQNLNLFTVITEDNVLSYQTNNLYTTTNSDLGEWGAGGKYASSTVYPYYAQHVARAAYGTTYNGTGGLIPQTIEGGKTYTAEISNTAAATVSVPDNCNIVVMMIDGNSGHIINAAQTSLTGVSGIESVTAEKLNAQIIAIPSAVAVSAEGDFNVEVYNLAGNLIAAGNGNGIVELPVNGATGVAIVRVASANATTVAKVVLK
jgi:hypothetical protein